MKVEKLFGQLYRPRVGIADTQFFGEAVGPSCDRKVVLWAPWMCFG
jgi:hypothetical protein